VTRKITRAVARISLGIEDELYLGNLDAIRDWGFAPEYVEAMWLMLQHTIAQDYVVATGTSYSVRDFLKASFNHVNLDWEKYTKYDKRYERPTEVDALIGNPSKAKKDLGWEFKTNPLQMASLMVEADLKLLKDPSLKVADALNTYWN
jgi:GDPmannose 4,6-dehydratase